MDTYSWAFSWLNAAAFNKENTELLKDFNAALKELKEDGTIDKIIAKYIKAD